MVSGKWEIANGKSKISNKINVRCVDLGKFRQMVSGK